MTESSANLKRYTAHSKTLLAPSEKGRGVISRRISFHLLLGLSVIAVVGAIYCWYLWYVTARTCLYAYILPQGAGGGQDQQHALLSILKHPGSWRECSWRDYFIALDITSIAALTLALFFTWLAFYGIRNTAWRRYGEGKAFFEHAYEADLLSRSFSSLCIQLGLLGTLLSFLLAAVAQIGAAISDTSTTRASPEVAESVLVKEVKAMAQETPPHDANHEVAASVKMPTQGSATPKANKELSSDIFLLLCASLVSAFVGAFLAYIVIPPLNLLNNCAVGAFQLDHLDEEATAEAFFRRIEQTTQRLDDFQSTTAALTEAAEGVRNFQKAAADAPKSFAEMIQMLRQVVEFTQVSNHRADALTKQLAAFQQQSERLLTTLNGFAIKVQDPLEWLHKSALSAHEASVAGRFAFVELREMAKEMQMPLDAATNVSRNLWNAVIEIRSSLGTIVACEKEQSSEMAALAQTCQGLQIAIRDLLQLLDMHSSIVRDYESSNVSMEPSSDGKPMEHVRQAPSAFAGLERVAVLDKRSSWWRQMYSWFVGAGPNHSKGRKHPTSFREDDAV